MSDTEASSQRSRCVIVAGGTGFIGRVVSARLRAAGHRVVVLARGRSRAPLPAGIELRRCDLGAPLRAQLLDGGEVLVNLVGIKREDSMSFTRAHVELPVELAAAAERAGCTQMIHISVAGADSPRASEQPATTYLGSKARGEQQLRARGGALPLTILRPGVVYGAGDDMLRNLADSIRAAPLFPAPRGGRAPIAPLAVEDLAEAVLRCVERPPADGQPRAFDIVGPEDLSLKQIIARVAAHPRVARSCVVMPAPASLQRIAARVLESISEDPLITRGQLELLGAGVVGDREGVQRELALETRALDAERIDAALAEFEPRLPSVRLVPDPPAQLELRELGGRASALAVAAFALVAVAALLLGPSIPASIWLRMAGLEAGLSALALLTMGLAWGRLWRPHAASWAWGLGAGVVMGAGAHAVAWGLGRIAPELWSEAAGIYAWGTQLPLGVALVLLAIIVAGEELVWRGVLGLGLVRWFGAWGAVGVSALLFTVAHLTTGPPVLTLAAAVAGGAWTWVAIRSRSLWASFVAHFMWDVGMLWVLPLI